MKKLVDIFIKDMDLYWINQYYNDKKIEFYIVKEIIDEK